MKGYMENMNVNNVEKYFKQKEYYNIQNFLEQYIENIDKKTTLQ